MEVRQTLLDHITLQEQLQAEGGFELWSGTDAGDGKRYLVSVLSSATETETVRARVESTEALVHHGILRTTERGVEDGAVVLAATIPAGFASAPSGPLSPNHAWTLLAQIIDALDYAHALGFVHGALSPATIFVNRADEIRLLNLGLGVNPKTTPWASPQQASDRRDSMADDVHALGAIAYEWLTGEAWRAGAEFPQSTASPSVRTTLLAMLSNAPYDRPQSVAEVRALLGNELAGGVELAPISTQSPPGQANAPTTALRLDEISKPASLPETHQRSVPLGLAAGMFVLLIIAAALVILVPGGSDEPPPAIVVQRPAPEPTLPVEETKPRLAPMELARLEQLREDASQAAMALLEILVDLEDASALDWAPDEYKRISLESNAGDILFRDDNPAAALEVYNTLRNEAAALYDTRFDVAAENKSTGTALFNAGKLEQARHHLKIARRIDSEDAAIEDMLRRLTPLEMVQAMLAEGMALEESGELDAALIRYENALAVDGSWPATRDAVAAVRSHITERNFSTWMSKGFAALERQDFTAAQQAFEAARGIKPESTEVSDGQSQAAFLKLAATIEKLANEARQEAAAEDWRDARKRYEAMLELDPSLVVAVEGRDNAIARQQLEDDISRYISNPLLLTSDAEYKQAKAFISRAGKLASDGSRLSVQVIELTTALTQARIPVNLEVRSDNQTDLSVASIGALGRIRLREIELYPGVYTIVGKRRGYKDVSVRVTLLAGSRPEPVFVRCSEKI